MTAEEFEQEAKALRPVLTDMAHGFLSDVEDAEDVVQDTMLKLWSLCGSLRRPMAPLARVLVRNICIDRIRRRRPTVDISQIDIRYLAPDASDRDRIDRMMSVVATLPPAYQVVLRLRHVDGMTMAEIAELTGGTETAVRKTLSRARMAVRKHYVEGQ